MKWTEPWLASIKNQENLNFLSKMVLKSCLSWTFVMFIMMLIASVTQSPGNVIDSLIRVSWLAPGFGFSLGWLLYLTRWLSPIKVDSGPNGIIRIKSDSILLFPWQKISGYELSNKKLKLLFIDDSPYEFLLSEKLELKSIREELEANRGKFGEL
jgi:hypothetical protein